MLTSDPFLVRGDRAPRQTLVLADRNSLTTFGGGAGAEAEVVTRANDVEHGLVAYVYTGDFRRGMRVAEALEAGMVAVNKGIVSDPAAPFGGVKQSGLGREGGHEGIFAFTETKYVAVDWSG